MKKKLFLFTFMLLTVHSLSAAPKTLIFGVEDLNLFPIYSSAKNTREYQGFARELFDLFAQKENYHITYRPLPIKRLFRSLLKKRVHFKFPSSEVWIPEDKKGINITYSAPILTIQGVVMTRPENKGTNKKPYELGTILGITPWPFLKEINTGHINMRYVPGTEILIRMVLKGRIDGAYTELAAARYHLQQLNRSQELVPDPTRLKIKPETYHLSTIYYPQIIKKFNHFLRIEKTAIKAIKEKYNL